MNRDIQSVMVLIPSLNPDQRLPRLVVDLEGQGFAHIVIVDDGSRPECKPVFDQVRERESCTVLTHQVNLGKGAGLKTGFRYFQEKREELGLAGVVMTDCDGQHLPADIARVARALLDEPTHLILGTRDFDDENVPFKSRNGNKITTQVVRVLYGRTIHDTQTGLRGVPACWMEQCLACRGERFEYEINMLIDAVRQGVPMDEVTIQTVYFDDNKESTFHPVRDSLRIYREIFAPFLRFSCSSVLCAALDQGLFALLRRFAFAGLGTAAGIWAATAAARVGSSLCNYVLNRTVVFQSGSSSHRSLIRYYLLAAAQMACSAGLVAALHAVTRVSPSALKLPVDILLFFVSYRIQQRWVFD